MKTLILFLVLACALQAAPSNTSGHFVIIDRYYPTQQVQPFNWRLVWFVPFWP